MDDAFSSQAITWNNEKFQSPYKSFFISDNFLPTNWRKHLNVESGNWDELLLMALKVVYHLFNLSLKNVAFA